MTQAPDKRRGRQPEPAKASTSRVQELRQRRAAEGLAEVRGIWARPQDHKAIKAAVKAIIESWIKDDN